MAPTTRGKNVNYAAQLHTYDHLEEDSSDEEVTSTSQQITPPTLPHSSSQHGRSQTRRITRPADRVSQTRASRNLTTTPPATTGTNFSRSSTDNLHDSGPLPAQSAGRSDMLDASAAMSHIKESPYGSDYASDGQPGIFTRLPQHWDLGNGRLASLTAAENAIPIDPQLLMSPVASGPSDSDYRTAQEEQSPSLPPLPVLSPPAPEHKKPVPLPLYHEDREDPWAEKPDPGEKLEINFDPVTGKSDEALNEFIHSRYIVSWQGKLYSMKPLEHCTRAEPPVFPPFLEVKALFKSDCKEGAFCQSIRICDKDICPECQGYWAWDLMAEDEKADRIKFGMPEAVWIEFAGQYGPSKDDGSAAETTDAEEEGDEPRRKGRVSNGAEYTAI